MSAHDLNVFVLRCLSLLRRRPGQCEAAAS
jgi:hypothetical protein